MDRMHVMAVFVCVGEERSFAAAARKLDMSPAAVTRAVLTLENSLGVKLLQRTTRSVRLTDAGQRYLDDARHILTMVAEADETASGLNSSPQGQLNVTAPVLFGKLYVVPSIVAFLSRHPAVQVSAFFLDRNVNVVEEGMDVAVRIGELPDSSLKALRVGTVRRVVCASPTYLARNGVPQQPRDLDAHTIIQANSVSRGSEWKFGRGANTEVVRIAPRMIVTSNDSAIEAAKAGLGVTRLMSYQIAPELAEGKLKLVLESFQESEVPVHLLHRESKYGSSKVRGFIDLLADTLRADRFLNP
ncbi:MAG: LysR family transcriptional regulator [Massilia sp.]